MNYKMFKVFQLCIWSFIDGLWFVTSASEMTKGNYTFAGWFLAGFSFLAVLVIWFLKQVMADVNS